MTKLRFWLLVGLACIVATLAALALVPEAGAQCNTIGQVQPAYSVVNVRGVAGNTTKTPIATVLRGTGVPVASTVQASGDTWYGRCEGGYLAGSVVTFVTNTPTPRPTIGIITPTRIPSATPGPTPTPDKYDWVMFSDGTLWQCELPCSFTIYNDFPTRK